MISQIVINGQGKAFAASFNFSLIQLKVKFERDILFVFLSLFLLFYYLIGRDTIQC